MSQKRLLFLDQKHSLKKSLDVEHAIMEKSTTVEVLFLSLPLKCLRYLTYSLNSIPLDNVGSSWNIQRTQDSTHLPNGLFFSFDIIIQALYVWRIQLHCYVAQWNLTTKDALSGQNFRYVLQIFWVGSNTAKLEVGNVIECRSWRLRRRNTPSTVPSKRATERGVFVSCCFWGSLIDCTAAYVQYNT